MRKAITVLVSLALLTLAACKKSSPANPGGSWTFKGVTYLTTTCIGYDSIGTLTATCTPSGSNTNSGSLTLQFFNVLPTGNGKYTVVGTGYPAYPYQVYVSGLIGTQQVAYQSTGGGGAEIVQVSYSNGLISVSGSGIELINSNNAADSSALSLNIGQLQ